MDFEEFADQAYRLLRQNWKSPTALGQELYAMLLGEPAGTPVRPPEPGPARPPDAPRPVAAKSEPAEATTIRERIRESIAREGLPPWRPHRPAEAEWRPNRPPEPRPRIRPPDAPLLVSGPPRFDQPFIASPGIFQQPAPFPATGGQDPFVSTPPVWIRFPDWDRKPPEAAGDWLPLDTPILPPGAGTTAYLGKVVSGSGDAYKVALYPDGKDGDAGDTVDVSVPQIADGEQIPAKTWIAPILQVDHDGKTEWWYQPPIWLS